MEIAENLRNAFNHIIKIFGANKSLFYLIESYLRLSFVNVSQRKEM